VRRYHLRTDFDRVGEFLIEHFAPDNCDGNWLQPIWEYMHSHPNFDASSYERIGIWEEAERIVAVAHYEGELGEAFFQFHPAYRHLRAEMLAFAEEHLPASTPSGGRRLRVYVNDFDGDFEALVSAQGYAQDAEAARPMSLLHIPSPFHPEGALPAGFRLKSLAEDNDLGKIHRVLWRGFNHAGEPPPEGIAWRAQMQSGPHFRKDLTIVVEAPNGDFVSFCGMWHEPANQIALVEPVATDPDYRRMGLGRAAVLEGIHRCAELGATVAFVGSDQPFYQALGFRVTYTSNCWLKQWQS
jgi:predicted N-acetyltransferase YhbS